MGETGRNLCARLTEHNRHNSRFIGQARRTWYFERSANGGGGGGEGGRGGGGGKEGEK